MTAISNTFETMPVADLIGIALGDDHDDATWQATGELQRRASRDAFDAAAALCASVDPLTRARGARILAQMAHSGWAGEDLSQARAGALLPLLADADGPVRLEGACALASVKDTRCLPVLVALTSAPDWDIRWSVVQALGGFDDRAATDALIAMTGDGDKLIRDWAAFALGSLTDADYPELRDALFTRTSDPDGVTRGEALKGLAERRDERVFAALDNEIRNLHTLADDPDAVLDCCLEAVKSLADPRLAAPLDALLQSLDESTSKRWGPLIKLVSDVCNRKPH